MRRASLSSGLTALALLWLSAVGAAAQDEAARAATIASERVQLTSRLERLREETAATEQRAAELGETLVDLAGDEARLRQRLEETAARIGEIEGRIADDEVALDSLTGDQALIRQELAGRRRELSVVLMALQRIGRRPPPALFAGEGGPTGVVRGAILLNAAIPGLDGEAQALAGKLAEAARLAADEEARWASLRSDLAEVQEERERLNALIDELVRRRALSLYERDQASGALARLAEEADTVEALLSRLSEEGPSRVTAPQGLAFSSRRGGLPDPVAGVVIGEYGDPTLSGSLSEGRIVAALPQSTVFAPMPATVLYAAPFRSYGHVLILDAGDGYHMVLTGLEESFVETGSRVEAGSPVGRMGARRGRSAVVPARNDNGALTEQRPLLYVELRRDGAAVDSHGWWRDPSPDGGRTSG